ncbi:uncharacterized protein LOC142740668 [Rhinoderma darwinii]|uniref:uncharacterized protein LOC142740668 n=1 Tax=Rhinoderma darwinii TaxID=43563 RepID=UPI003F6635A4
MSHISGKHMINIKQYEENVVESKSSKNTRRRREFVPDEMKDDHYWEKRRRNNQAAKKSREKRRLQDYVTENRMLELNLENSTLKAELLSIKSHLGLISPSEYIRHGHASRKTSSICLPHDQIIQIDFPFPSMNSINYGSRVFSRVSVKDLMENHAHFKNTFSRKETMYNFNCPNQLPAASPNHDLIDTSLYDIHIATSVPSLMDHSGSCDRLSQELPSIHNVTLPFCSRNMSGEQRVFALPHKLRIKSKTFE